MSGEVYLLWLLYLLQTLSAYGAELSSEACRELGFSSNLLCPSCDLLGEFSLTKLQPNCQQCCQQEALMEPRKRILNLSFTLLLCLSKKPWIVFLKRRVTREQAFVRSEKPKMFKGLQIKYVRGSDPVLKLLDDEGNISEELSILKWNTDSVEEFLSEKLDRI
ncbi:Selenoprotein F [Takifugu flavidus]|uniref:Selenoprotein F n=1 Tax=Takifugu flavidus TaxID=433684 RepID=A0A5C6P0G1_9TELE|nr:Selenoprotein F [Takifugu flavidus]